MGDAAAFEELSADGKTAPKAAQKIGGSTFKIKCTDDGFPQPVDQDLANVAPQASVADLKRARTKVPRGAFRGDNFEKMSHVLNGHMRRTSSNTKGCELWAVEELQQFQVLMMLLRDPSLDSIYHNSTDNRRIRRAVHELKSEWETINALAKTDRELARVHRDGHCHEAVMWYVHHLSQETRDVLKDKITLPLLSYKRHQSPTFPGKMHAEVHRSYEEKVTCFSCHSNALPSSKDAAVV